VKPAISAVIPTYQRAELVGRAIDSVLAQSSPPVEVIVVDDGSTDDTPARLREYGDRVVTLRQDNAGGAAARNLGVRHASGDWIAFCDSDDLWRPDHLARIVAAIEGTGAVADVYFDDVQRTDAEGGGTTFEAAGLVVEDGWVVRHDARGWAVAARQPTMLQGAVVRRATYCALGGLWSDLSSRHDTHFFYRLLIDHPACAVAGIGATMTADDDPARRLTAGNVLRRRRYWECSVRLYRDLLERRDDPDERRVLRDLLARSHKRLGRSAFDEHAWLEGAACWWHGFRASPLTIPWSVVARNRPTPGIVAARRALGE
jgi:glycosyltransferase involved in cell wall biosynthesis